MAAISEEDAWYDAEIAPALAELAQRCHEHGMSFISLVEYQAGDRALTQMFTEKAGIEMHMVSLCSRTAPNVDSYILNLKRYCKMNGIDTSGSVAMNGFGQSRENI